MKVMVLAASGMFGSTMLRALAQRTEWDVVGTVRSARQPPALEKVPAGWVFGVDLNNQDQLAILFRKEHPDVVINCAGLTKHLPGGNDPVPALNMNALLPHRLAELCGIAGARLVHISTDCVFSGKKGNYRESDETDAIDVYGKTKQLGEVAGPGLVTLRTSIIGHEMGTQHGLLEWFLAQESCKGYRKAIFSGLSTLELAKVVRDVVIPNDSLEGIYHVSSDAIDKDSLLRLIARIYKKNIEIEADDKFVIDRSLDSTKFSAVTGYRCPKWPDMIEAMHQDGGGWSFENV